MMNIGAQTVLSRRVAWSACLLLLGGLFTPMTTAAPITYNTEGTVEVSNEPDHTLVGLVGQPARDRQPGDPDYFPAWPILLGYTKIVPMTPFESNGVGPPMVAGSPFDIRIAFNQSDLPTLELKGVFGDWVNGNPFSNGYGFIGKLDSITSSNPALDAGLPAPFAAMLANPDGVKLGIGMWDWDIDRLQVLAAYQPVPEPATASAFLVLAVGLGIRARHHARRKVTR